jgi:hypothetical protein
MNRRFSPDVAPVVEAHLQRHFHGGGAVVRVEALRESGRRNGRERFGELDDRLVREARQDHLLEALELRRHRRVDARVRVAEEVHPPGADGVEITLAGEILEPHARAAPDGDHRHALVILHLRARMPHVRQIPLDKVARD